MVETDQVEERGHSQEEGGGDRQEEDRRQS
jgi:hypothetical protein